MNKEGELLQEIKRMLLRFGFKETVVTNQYRSETNYVYKNLYCIPGYVNGLGFIMEYASSFEEAQNHLHEDGDAFPLEMGEQAILSGLENEIRQALSDL